MKKLGILVVFFVIIFSISLINLEKVLNYFIFCATLASPFITIFIYREAIKCLNLKW